MSKTKTYRIWDSMRQRCQNPNDKGYRKYGARGITVCERWRSSFSDFLSDMGHAPTPQHSIDRIDNDGPYSPENCRWATTVQQARNKRTNVWLEHDGQRRTVAEWAETIGIKPWVLHQRLAAGWSDTDALFTPVRPMMAKSVKSLILQKDGMSLTLEKWAELTGIPCRIVRRRVRDGWPMHRALDPIGTKL